MKKLIEGHRILIVEDSNDAREYISRVLKEAGARVASAPDGQVALQTVESSQPELILMDMQMPVMNGDEATKALRRLGYTMPIVALTGKAISDDQETLKETGFTSYLPKPVAKGELLRVISHLLSPQCQ
jgi:CheY-like chemotaxis protein